jgi:protease-4
MSRRALLVVLTLLGSAVVISLTAFFTMYLMLSRAPVVPSSATLTLNLSGDLAENPPDDVLAYFRGSRLRTLRSVVDTLRKAKADRRVTALVLKPNGFTTAYWAKIQEVRDAVLDFKSSGKPVYAFLEYGGDRDYYLATAADKVFLMPSATLDLTGVATYELFLRGSLDKLGIYPDLHHVGAYKNAVNTFTEKSFTEAHREVTDALNRSLYDEIVRGIAGGRRKDNGAVRTLIDQGPFLSEQALKAGLVDELAYEDQVEERLRATTGAEKPVSIDADDYAGVGSRSLGLNVGPRIAVIYAEGIINSGRSGFDPLNGAVVGSDTLNEYIKRVRDDSSIRAIVLRIDSPGGSATASDAIWRELMLTKGARADRPIVASMSDLAASGGYYIAMPADAIVAQPSTLTGSIGVFGGKFVTGGLYKQLGANVEAASIGRRAELNSPVRAYNDDEVKKVQEYMQSFYDRFVENVADSRKRTPEDIDRIAQGRVWTGRQAVENGLVDALGGLDRAIALAKERAQIPADTDVELVVYPPRRTIYELLSEQISASGAGAGASLRAWLSEHLSAGELEALRALRGPLAMFRRGEPLALMPFLVLR